mmetsp:Transcript_27301/g.68825  ORF Transcript_27301/g.68825 Transcript_27301/m.68825 type:complete len:297 (+) Transcript_27301:71-961(+)|eukprot:CAMPEP_0173420544 /NCGR_PEP_ID=MMETSP1357-20121228/1980_1 /TAXON_ID=77926 /ORGANISM="Hemiselmis rufescens, Strain PCC563" /LENGTH=296 /DNA_ID=CAMNT_0014383339 /DNA_START=69 /DNA_END=959 /DNA_ORIENTATION=+
MGKAAKTVKGDAGPSKDKKPSVGRTVLLVLCILLFCPLTGIPGILALLFAPIFGLCTVQTFTWRCSVCFFRIVLWAAGCSYTVVGLENLDESETYFFCSNHESHFDVPLIFSTLPFWLISIAKKSLMYIPVFGWAVAAGGTVWIDRKNTEKALNSMGSAEKSLRARPRSVIVFPEGTRSRDGKLQPFKKGGIVLAIQTGMPVVPVCVHNTLHVVEKGGRWVTPQPLTVCYGKPIPTDKLTFDDRDLLVKKLEDAIVELKSKAPRYSGRNPKPEPFWRCFLRTPPPSVKDAWGRVPP